MLENNICGFEFSWRDEIKPNTPEAIFENFRTEPEEGANILFADYNTCCYSGKAFVLFEKDGKLYEVNGGHCSCNGLEGQWEPEETSKEALIARMEASEDYGLGAGCCGHNFRDELRTVLDGIPGLQ